MKEKNLLTSFIDFIDERTSSIVPFKYLVAKTNARKISMLLLTIIMLSTFSPVAMNAQGLFSDALDNISSNTSNSDDSSEDNSESIGEDSSTEIGETSVVEEERSLDKDLEEGNPLTEEERIELNQRFEQAEAEEIWNQKINNLTSKDLEKLGIVETEEEADATINVNFSVKEVIKLFLVVDNYENLDDSERTTEMTETYNKILSDGPMSVDARSATDSQLKLLIDSEDGENFKYIDDSVNSVIRYNTKNYTISDEFYYVEGAVTYGKTVNKEEYDKAMNKNTRSVTVKSANIHNSPYYGSSGEFIVGFYLSNGESVFCIQIDSDDLNAGDNVYTNQRSTYFQTFSPEAQALVATAASIETSTVPSYDSSSDLHGSQELSSEWIATQAFIWGAQTLRTDGNLTADKVVVEASTQLPAYTAEIHQVGDRVKITMNWGTPDQVDDLEFDTCTYSSDGLKQPTITINCVPKTKPDDGDVIIEKTYEDEGYSDYDREYSDIEIVVTNSSGAVVGQKPLDSNGRAEFDDLSAHGNPYTWTEINNTDDWSTVVGTGTFNINEDDRVVVDLSAGGPVNHLRFGRLKVHKLIDNDTTVPYEEIVSPDDVEIHVYDNETDFDWEETKTLDSDWNAEFEHMPFGNYTVEESTYDSYNTKQIIGSQTVEIKRDEADYTYEVTLENEIKWGNLKVIKDIVNDTGIDENTILDPSDVTITIESMDGYSTFPREQTLDSNWSTTFEKLPWGNYHVIETAYDQTHSKQILGEAYISMSDANPGDENTRELSITSPGDDGGYIQNEILWANLLIRKDIINDTEIPTNTIVDHSDIRIHVESSGEDFVYDQDKPLDSNWEAYFEYLPVGHYHVEEYYTTDAMKTIIGELEFDVMPSDDEQTIEISIDNPWDGDQFIQNEIIWANLYVEKNMVNDTATPTEELTSPDEVWIRVESVGESFNYYEEHQLDSNWSTTFEKMPVGHYKVTEYDYDADYTKQIMWETEIDITAADDEQTLEMSKDHPWPGTDFYIENEILWANLLVTKNMINDTAVPVEDITSPDQVEITVESLDGYHIDGVHTSITKTLNNHWEALFPKLPVGHYRITETTWDETHTKQIQNIVEIEITPADDETIIYIDKDHPVGDAYIENEILWANVLITKNMINDTEIPTDDITSPSQVVITLESLDGYRLDGTNTSISGTLDSEWSILFPKIPVGHYKVTETVWDQTHTKQIMSEVTFEVKPEDDESIIYIDKDHPVGDAYIENEILWANVIFTKDVINLDDFSEDAIENIDKSQIKIHVQSVGETFSYDKTLSLDDDWSVMFEKLPVGHYHYTEELPNPSNMEVIIGEGDFEVTPADDETIIRIDKDNPGPDGNFIQNRLKEFTFRLTVRDSITEERLGAGYEFAVYDEEPEVKVVKDSDVFRDEGDTRVLTDSDHDYITDEIPLFTMQTDREGEAVSPVLPFDTDGTQDLYIYETDVETDQYGNESYFLNDGGILLHAEADVSDGEEIQVEYFNLKKDYAQMRTNTAVVDTEGNSVEDFDLSGFEYTIFDKDENSENYGNIAESVAVDGIPAEEQILVSDADGKANSGVLHANLSLNSFNNKPADERMDYTVEPSGFPDGMTEEMFKQVPDPYDFSTNGLTKLFYYDAVYVIDDATLEIDKVDQDDNPLEGAEFTIYEDLDTNSDGTYITDNDKEVDTITSDENGIAKISLPRSADYYVQETEAPEGYDIDETVYKVEFNEEGKETIKVEDELISEKIRTDLILYNKDGSTGQIITEPATFELRYTYDGHEEVLTGITTNGKMEFNNVPVVDTDGSEIIYTLQEVKAPGDYTIDNNEYQFELYFDSNGDIQYETVYSQATGKLETTTQDATAYTGTGTLEDIPEDVNDTTVDMDFYNYKEDSTSDIVDEMPDTALGFFVK